MNAHAFDYPEEAGHRGVDTSMDAAAKINGVLRPLQQKALREIRAAGMFGLTAQELADRLELDLVSIQPRTTELKVKGLIEDSGDRRRNRRGNRSIVWIATSREAAHG